MAIIYSVLFIQTSMKVINLLVNDHLLTSWCSMLWDMRSHFSYICNSLRYTQVMATQLMDAPYFSAITYLGTSYHMRWQKFSSRDIGVLIWILIHFCVHLWYFIYSLIVAWVQQNCIVTDGKTGSNHEKWSWSSCD